MTTEGSAPAAAGAGNGLATRTVFVTEAENRAESPASSECHGASRQAGLPLAMLRIRWRHAVIAVVGAGGFGLYWASIAFAWNPPLWLVIAGGAGALLVISLLSLPRLRRGRNEELYASDPYSDVYLGRDRPVHPYRDAKPTSQISGALPVDPVCTSIQRSPTERDQSTTKGT